MRRLVESFVGRFPAGVRGYVKENWGAPFVVAFMALLVVAAGSLVLGFGVFADGVAVYGYYVLVVGVVLQLACLWKYRSKEGEQSQ
jgi:hypothetical protein